MNKEELINLLQGLKQEETPVNFKSFINTLYYNEDIFYIDTTEYWIKCPERKINNNIHMAYAYAVDELYDATKIDTTAHMSIHIEDKQIDIDFILNNHDDYKRVDYRCKIKLLEYEIKIFKIRINNL